MIKETNHKSLFLPWYLLFVSIPSSVTDCRKGVGKDWLADNLAPRLVFLLFVSLLFYMIQLHAHILYSG